MKSTKKPAEKKSRSKKTKKENQAPAPEAEVSTPDVPSQPDTDDWIKPTPEEIEGIKEHILETEIFNPYAIVVYNLMSRNTYEDNAKLVQSMRHSFMKIEEIRRTIVEQVREEEENKK